ncbi:YadA C-terminal domain-containing protein, partial [uncultured Megasphaera sp.]|uniref:YadA C-terminal domain-containing protein n=1 Tax=uncultured Megasphaera sp. TaxID=165188 RepID=UPI00259BAD6D
GLTKDVNANKKAIGDANSGLTKDVKALQDAVGDDSKGLTKDVNANKKAIGDANSGLTKAVNANKADLAKKADKSELEDYVRKSDLKIGNNAKDIQKVGARAAALAGLHPLEFDPSTKLSFAVSSGSYDGENSVAFGAFYRPTKNVMLSAASTMGSKNAYTFGMSFKFGESSATTTTNTPDVQELYRVVGQLQYQVAAQQQEIQQLRQAAQKTK